MEPDHDYDSLLVVPSAQCDPADALGIESTKYPAASFKLSVSVPERSGTWLLGFGLISNSLRCPSRLLFLLSVGVPYRSNETAHGMLV